MYLQSIADREPNETRADILAAEYSEQCSEKYDKVANHLQSHCQPAVRDAAWVVTRLVMVHASFRFLHKPDVLKKVIKIDKTMIVVILGLLINSICGSSFGSVQEE